MNTFYNVGSADISQGLQDFEISSGQDYFILLSAPSNANVQIRLNENTAPLIPIKEHWQFKSADVKKIYISCEPISGESIKWGQADGNLEITTNPTINQIDTIGQMGASYLAQLDKITNPYDLDNIEISSGGSNSSSFITIFSETANYDKLIVDLTPPFDLTEIGCWARGGILLYIDDILALVIGGTASSVTSGTLGQLTTITKEFKGIKNKKIEIKSKSGTSVYSSKFYLQKISKKA